ncbi:hypothetical protein Tco_0422412 [Tanacetum coccineum]
MGPTVTPGQEPTLPYVFTTKTLHDPTTGAWNMDTGASSHLNASVTNLNNVFNTCIYLSIVVGDELKGGYDVTKYPCYAVMLTQVKDQNRLEVVLDLDVRHLHSLQQQLILEFSLVMHQLGKAVQVPAISAGTPSSTTIDQDAPSPSHSPSSSELQPSVSHQGVAAGSTLIKDNPFAHADNVPFVNVFAPESSSKASSSEDVSSAESTYVTQPHHHLGK